MAHESASGQPALAAKDPFELRVGLGEGIPEQTVREALASGDMGFLHSFTTGSAVDGPGVRVVAWTTGCMWRCQYCHNPDTWTLKNGIPVSGQLDCASWEALSAASPEPTTMPYEVTAADARGPFAEHIPADIEKQASLPALNYRSVVELVGDYLGAVRLSEVESVQQRIVDIVRHLEEAGEISTQQADEDDEFVT